LVDEGILSLTSFKTPDPLSQIFQKRALGVITYDTVGWNVGLPQSVGGPMGGGEGGGEGMRPGVKPVALFKGPLEVPKKRKTRRILQRSAVPRKTARYGRSG
jgi:uncharacterized protein YfaS (alpha-2-macroglobulin family)